MIDTASDHDAGSAGADFPTTRDLAASVWSLGESLSGRLLTQIFEENLLLFAEQESIPFGRRCRAVLVEELCRVKCGLLEHDGRLLRRVESG
jgi:hypothetical protein